MFTPRHPPPPVPDGIRDRLGQEPDLFDQLDEGQADEFKDVHKAGSLPPLLVVEQGAENDDGRFIRSGHGIRFGGRNQGAHVRGDQLQVRVLCEELVELLLQGGCR